MFLAKILKKGIKNTKKEMFSTLPSCSSYYYIYVRWIIYSLSNLLKQFKPLLGFYICISRETESFPN